MKLYFSALLFTIVLIPSLAFSQFSNYGLKFGMQSVGTYSNLPIEGRTLGFGLYGFAERELNKNVFAVIDLGITQRGFTNYQIQTDETGQFIRKVEADTKTIYASLATFLNLQMQFENIVSYFGIAPRFDFLILKSLGEYEYSTIKIEEGTANLLNDFVFGGSVVTGIKNLSIAGQSFRIEAKYEIDVTNSLRDLDWNFRNDAIMLVLGINL